MSEKKNKKILKLYNVALDDIDNKGNINPDAKLLPLFHHFYHVNPDDVKETLSSEDWYDDRTNVHDDRHFYIDLPDGRRLYQPVKHRGYSALSYYTKPDRADSLFDDWHHDKKSGKDDNSIRVHNRDEVVPKEITDGIMPRHRADDEGNLYAWINDKHLKNRDIISKRDRIGNGSVKYDKSDALNYLTLPVIADIDDEDIIRLHDVLNNNYDPGRDDLNEVQVRHLRNKVIPQGWFKFFNKDDVDNTIENEIRDYFTGKLDSKSREEAISNFYATMRSLYGFTPRGKDKYYKFNQLLDKIRYKGSGYTASPISDKEYNDIADFLHNAVAEEFKLSNNKNKFLFNSNMPGIVLKKYFPYDSDVTVSDKHYKQIIDDLYDDVQKDKTRSNITNTLMEAKYV